MQLCLLGRMSIAKGNTDTREQNYTNAIVSSQEWGTQSSWLLGECYYSSRVGVVAAAQETREKIDFTLLRNISPSRVCFASVGAGGET